MAAIDPATELVAYASTGAFTSPAVPGPIDDTSQVVGGAIYGGATPTYRVFFSVGDVPSGTGAQLQFRSSVAGDTGANYPISFVGRKADGTLTTAISSATLLGTTNVTTTATDIVALESFGVTGGTNPTGTVTIERVSDGQDLHVIPVGERGVIRLFRNAQVPTSGTNYYYEKIFLKNRNTTNALLSATITEVAGGKATITSFAVETSVGGSNSYTLARFNTTGTTPAAINGTVTAFSDTSVTLATATGITDLALNSAIGVWVRLTLANTETAIGGNGDTNDFYTIQLSGSTST